MPKHTQRKNSPGRGASRKVRPASKKGGFEKDGTIALRVNLLEALKRVLSRKVLDQYPLDHRKAALLAGLARHPDVRAPTLKAFVHWLEPPYRELGQAYHEALQAELNRNPTFHAQTSLPLTEDWAKWLETSEAAREWSPFGQWMRFLGWVQAEREASKGWRLPLFVDSLAILRKSEGELGSHGSSLEEIFIFESLLRWFGERVKYDQLAAAIDVDHAPRMKVALLFNNTVRQITTILQKEKLAPRTRLQIRQLLEGASKLEDVVSALKPKLPHRPKERRRLLQHTKYKALFREVIIVALEVMILRGLRLTKEACPLLVEVLPLLFPKTILFPDDPHDYFPAPRRRPAEKNDGPAYARAVGAIQVIYQRHRF